MWLVFGWQDMTKVKMIDKQPTQEQMKLIDYGEDDYAYILTASDYDRWQSKLKE